ncbi:hypothetical protein Tco_0821298 [Tanacetum coccineum]|uniref:Uncharacterized protein n=1 Tax=Tanacetum coccineum TaxID=301880 RepID=A0ABQ5AGM5_9ASTR
MILESVEHGPLIWPIVEENGVIRTKKYAELSAAEKIQVDCDMKATNIILQGLPVDIYSLERECKLYDAFDKFTHTKGESLHTKFVTDVKLVKDLHISNFDQLHAYLEQHELHANEVRILRERNQDPLAFVGSATSSRGNTISGQARVVKYYNFQGEGHMARQCTQPKRPRNAAWYNEKAMFTEALEAGQILDEKQLAFLADPKILADQAQTIIPHNAAFQTEDLDTYDSDCDDLSTAQAVLMANISNYSSDTISEVPNSKTYLNDMDNQSVHALHDFEQTPVMDFTDNEISTDSNSIPYS